MFTVSRAGKLLKCIHILKLLVELIPPTSANSWQLYGEELNWHQFVAVMTEPFSMWNRRENVARYLTGTL